MSVPAKIKAMPGRIVMYRLPHGPNIGHIRPAIIVQAHSDDCATLRVFSGIGDGFSDCFLATSVLQGIEYGQWYKPEHEE